jgi:hypothetical protein
MTDRHFTPGMRVATPRGYGRVARVGTGQKVRRATILATLDTGGTWAFEPRECVATGGGGAIPAQAPTP